MRKFSFLGNVMKISISVLNQLKNKKFKICYSSLQYILLKMTINLPLKGKISTRAVTSFWDPFWRQVQNVDLPSNFSKISFLLTLSYKKSKSVKHRVIGSLFRRYQLIKDGGAQICTPLIWIGFKWVRQQLRTFLKWVLSSVIIIAQNDTRNIEYM